MKKMFILLVMLFAFVVNAKADTLYIDGYQTLEINGNSELVVTDGSGDNYNDYVLWASLNESIATVDASGVVTGVQLGKTTITAKILIHNNLVVLLGDISGDGQLKADDLTLLNRYIDGLQTLSNAQQIVADVNADEIIDADDSDLLGRVVANITTLSDEDVTIPLTTAGIALYYDSYATDEDFITLTYDIEVVDEIKSITIDQVITAFKNSEYFSYTLSQFNGDIVYQNNQLIISYDIEGERIEWAYDVIDGVITYDTGTISNNEEAGQAFGNIWMLAALSEAILDYVGYNNIAVDYEKISLQRNGLFVDNYGDEREFTGDGGTISIGEFAFYLDLNHIFFSEDDILSYDYDYEDFIDEIYTSDQPNTIIPKPKQAEVDNPKTGLSLPMVGLGVMLLVSVGSIYYTNKKRAFIKF